MKVSDRFDERGTGLVELIVTVAILTIVLGVVLTGFVSMQSASAGSNERILDLNEARLIMATTSKDLRTATQLNAATAAFTIAKTHEIEFYSALNTPTGDPVKVHLYIDGQSRLVETVATPDPPPAPPAVPPTPPIYGTAPKQRMVAEYVANKATDPIFTYYKADGSVLDASAGLSAANAQSVVAVGLKYVVRHDTKLPVAPTTLINRIRLPNTGYAP